jgi:hypothetical protein
VGWLDSGCATDGSVAGDQYLACFARPSPVVTIDEPRVDLNIELGVACDPLCGLDCPPQGAGDNQLQLVTPQDIAENRSLMEADGIEFRIEMASEYPGRVEGSTTVADQVYPDRSTWSF